MPFSFCLLTVPAGFGLQTLTFILLLIKCMFLQKSVVEGKVIFMH